MTLDVRPKVWALFQAAACTDSARSWFNERGRCCRNVPHLEEMCWSGVHNHWTGANNLRWKRPILYKSGRTWRTGLERVAQQVDDLAHVTGGCKKFPRNISWADKCVCWARCEHTDRTSLHVAHDHLRTSAHARPIVRLHTDSSVMNWVRSILNVSDVV